jgi:RNA polymerase sigma factor (sigma-70 family)
LPPEDWAALREEIDVDALYRSQGPRLSRFFARRVASTEVHDLVHEVFRRLIGATSSAVSVRQPEAYLHRVATNLLRDRGRSPSYRLENQPVPLDEDLIAGPDPHLELERRDSIARIDAALATVKPKTREIFMLHRLDGLSYAEIATIKGMSVKGVEKQIAKALTTIRRRLDSR